MNRRLHDQRQITKGYSSPETGRMYLFDRFFSIEFNLVQTEQVRIVLDEIYRKSEIYQKSTKKNFV
jgi:hypothetical protein